MGSGASYHPRLMQGRLAAFFARATVLTEKGFMDSEASLAFLESDEGERAIVALHVDGIDEYVNSF